MNKEDFNKNCFSPNWLDIDLRDAKIEEEHTAREERLESKNRKDLSTLLQELASIKQNIEKVAEKQHRLVNLMGFYSGNLAQ